MTQKQIPGNSVPEAYISRTKDQSRGRYKVFDDKIYIENGQEFEIELFNPTEKLVMATLSFNGKNDGQTGIVLKPGQRIYLDRYLAEAVKFKFETYEVDNTPESLAAIAKNGLIKISFYEESDVKTITRTNGNSDIFIGDFPPYWQRPHWDQNRFWYNTNIGTTCSNNSNRSFDLINDGRVNLKCNFSNNEDGFSYLSNDSSVNYSASEQLFDAKISMDQIESGRIEKGAKSEQEFVDANYNFKTYTCKEITYTLLPVSRKPLEAKDLTTFCTQCGTKAKKNHKFCANCGAKLE